MALHSLTTRSLSFVSPILAPLILCSIKCHIPQRTMKLLSWYSAINVLNSSLVTPTFCPSVLQSFPPGTCASSTFWIRFNIFLFMFSSTKKLSVARAFTTPHQHFATGFHTALQVMSFHVSAAPLFSFRVESFSIHLDPRHVPRIFECLLRFPHLMHLYIPPKSLHCLGLCFLPSLIFCTRWHESFPFGTVSSRSFHSSTCTWKCAAHSIEAYTPFLGCFVVQTLAAAIYPPSTSGPSLAKSSAFSFPSITYVRSFVVAFLSIPVRCAFTCFRSQFFPRKSRKLR